MSERAMIDDLWRHKKTGGVYRVLDFVMLEREWQEGVVYIPEPNPEYKMPVVRLRSEFEDGRFELVGSLSPPQDHSDDDR